MSNAHPIRRPSSHFLVTRVDADGTAWSGAIPFRSPIAHDGARGPIKAGDAVEVDRDLSTDDAIAYIRVGDFQ